MSIWVIEWRENCQWVPNTVGNIDIAVVTSNSDYWMLCGYSMFY